MLPFKTAIAIISKLDTDDIKMNITNEILEILLDFGGGQGGRPGDIAVRFLLPSFFWSVLASVAVREWRRTRESKDRFIGIAALIGLSRELLMFTAEYGSNRGFLSFESLYPFYPPFEHAATMLSGIFISTAFINYLLEWPTLSRRFFGAASAVTLIIYVLTAALWPVFLRNHPGIPFGSFWGDMVFRIAATFFLSIVLGVFIYGRLQGFRVQIALVLGILFLLLDEMLMIINLSTGERHVAIYAPIRHNLHIWAIPLFLGVYWSDLNHRLGRALHGIREERHLSQGIIAAVGDGISIQDRNFRVLYQNRIQQNMTGKHQGDLCYKAYENREIMCDGCPVERAMQDGKVHRGERSVDLTGGGKRHVEITASPLRDADGRIVAGVEVVRDITERKRLADEMSKIEKLESVGLLAGGIAHDFNNLLTGIFGNISLAKMHAAGDDLIVERLCDAEKASLRASELTRQLLTFSKGGMPVKKNQPIGGIIKEAIRFTLTGSPVKAVFELPDDLPPLDIDAGQMHQVFSNLALNAVQAMPNGGALMVTAGRDRIEEGSVVQLPAGEYVRISVSDTGHGIPPELLSKIFDPYFTTKENGTGLGLASVYSIVKKHGGAITARSGAGSGAIFDIHLPLSASEWAGTHAAKRTVLTGSGHVLVMDDDQLIRDTAGQLLKTLGYEYTIAKDGAEALSLYQAARRSNNPYDAVILDLTVPGGVGGRDAMQNLLALDRQAVGIVSSGYSNDPVMAEYTKFGFKAMLAKPYDAQALGHALREALNR